MVAAMTRPALRDLLERRTPAFGTMIVEVTTPGIGHILAGAGCEFAFLDMEHTGFGFETVKSTLQYLRAAGVPAVVRVPSHARHHICRAADVGAEGVMLAMVGSAAEAEAAVAALKYTPDGSRGVAFGIAHDDWLARPAAEAMAAANRRTTLFAMIETGDGVANAEAIAAVRGVDCLWVGHFDLSASLGIPGQFDHPAFRDAIARVTAVARAHGRALGRMVGSLAEARQARADGFHVLAYSGDAWLLQAALRDALGMLRNEG